MWMPYSSLNEARLTRLVALTTPWKPYDCEDSGTEHGLRCAGKPQGRPHVPGFTQTLTRGPRRRRFH